METQRKMHKSPEALAKQALHIAKASLSTYSSHYYGKYRIAKQMFKG